jgi:hypothetical protein
MINKTTAFAVLSLIEISSTKPVTQKPVEMNYSNENMFKIPSFDFTSKNLVKENELKKKVEEKVIQKEMQFPESVTAVLRANTEDVAKVNKDEVAARLSTDSLDKFLSEQIKPESLQILDE